MHCTVVYGKTLKCILLEGHFPFTFKAVFDLHQLIKEIHVLVHVYENSE